MRSNKLPHFNDTGNRLFLAMILLRSLAACGNNIPASQSPGVKLVQNAATSGLPTIVEFGAVGCSSCREMKIVLDNVAKRTQGRANVLSIDVYKDEAAAEAFQIQLIPTQVFFDAHGKEIERNMGILTEAAVIARLGLGDMQK